MTAELYYIGPRLRTARKASVTAHPDKLKADLSEWQNELSKELGCEETAVTVVVVLNGHAIDYEGPFTYANRAAFRRAGITGIRSNSLLLESPVNP